MLEAADVTKADTVYDLGSGDGRIVITAAQKFGARAVGVEIDEELVEKTRQHIKDLGIDNRVEIVHAHLMDVDFSPASVVTLYLLTSSNKMLRPKLEQSLKQGTRVVCHDFRIEGWEPVLTEKVGREGRTHTIYLYQIGHTAPGSNRQK
jgi:predicted RNA methylase